MNDDHIDDMITRAVLGELTDDELATLDAALADDPQRRAELDADLAAAAGIQRAAAAAPPPRLKDGVLAAIAGTTQEGAPGADDRPAPSPLPPTVTTLDSRRRSRFASSLLAAAAVIALVVGGVIVAGDRGGPSSFDAVASAPDAQLRSLDGTLEGSLRVIYSAEEQALVVDGANLPTLGPDETYQLWLVPAGGDPMSAGLFRPDRDGRVMQRFDGLDPTGVTVGVTVEPAGGSVAPTTPIVASA